MTDCNAISKKPIEPFLKWVGGKRWLVYTHGHIFNTHFERYIEPFLGSGAVFFFLVPQKAILSDRNKALIDTYNAIKTDWHKVYVELVSHQANHSTDYYYKVRSMKLRNPYAKAAQFIYLNRTCWNGLYRVNLKGNFNVPKGTKDKVLLESDDFENVAKMLLNAEIVDRDFEKTINMAKEGDLLFVDPPYTVNHNHNSFLKYNESIFSWDDQVRLSECVKKARRRGVKICLTNADHLSVKQLYKDEFVMTSVPRSSVLSGLTQYRGEVTELLVLGNL
jgi:DNA adenine methylase